MKFPTVENSAFVMIDMQQKLLPAMSNSQQILERNMLLLNAAAVLNMDVLVTEQYPKGLGATVPELSTWLGEKSIPVAKTGFSVFCSPEFQAKLLERKREVLIFFGIEAHVCVLQSVLDAVAGGYEVIVVADAVSSRKTADCERALDMMRDQGVSVLNSESVLFMLLRDAAHPAFKAISKLIK